MRVLHVVPRVARESSGPSYSVPMLCGGLCGLGLDVELKVLEPLPNRELPFPIQAYGCWPTKIANRLGVSPSMKRAIRSAAERVQVIHNHSLWMMPNIYVGSASMGADVKLVISPRGTFAEWSWKRAKVRKTLVWRLLGQRKTCVGAALFHATSELEYLDIRRRGFRQPVAIIPNGIESKNLSGTRGEPIRRTLLFLSRIHPTKQVEKLLAAWAQVQNLSGTWCLDIVGAGEKEYVKFLQELAAKLELKRCRFIGELHGDAKWNAYSSADLFVLPSASENFAMVIAEALSAGTPVITTTKTPWKSVAEKECGWWIADDVSQIASTLAHAMQLDAEKLRSMGAKGRDWMLSDFSWAAVSESMRSTYQWLVDGGPVPAAVVLE